MNQRLDELGAIREVVARATVFSKTYEGKVLDNNDELNRGRVKVSIQELRWEKPAECPWVEPEYHHGQSTPIKDEWVVVYFLNGDISRPVYRGRTGEKKVSRYTQYKDPNTVLLYQDDGENQLSIIYHRDTHLIEGKLGEKFTFKVDAEGNIVDLVLGEKTTFKFEDGKFKLTFDKTFIESDGSKWTLDADGNTIEHESSKTTIAGNLEVSK